MNKLLTKIAGLTLGLTMAIGVGVATFATADEPVGVHAAVVGTSYTVSDTAATTITNNGLYVLKQSSAGFNGTIDSNWAKTTTTSTSWFVLKATGSETGFTLSDSEDETKFIYCSAAKKIAWSSSSTTFKLMKGKKTTSINNAVGNDTVGTLQVGTSGIRPYTTSTGADFQLFEVQAKIGGTVSVQSITLDRTQITMQAGTKETIAATVYPDNATNQIVSWKSSNDSIATVSNEGVVTALGEGSTTITATSADNTNISSSCQVTVTAPTIFYNLVTDVSDLNVGDNVIIASSDYAYAMSTQKDNNRGAAEVVKNGDVLYSNDSVQIFTLGAGVSDGTYSFYEKDKGYLYASSSSANNLKLQPTLDANGSWNISIADGVASIVATGTYTRNTMQFNYTNNPKLFACYDSASQKGLALYVEENTAGVDITSIEITNGEEITMKEKETVQLEYTVLPQNYTENILFISSEESVATVDVDGTITALSAGETTITVKSKSGDAQDSIDVTVTKGNVKGISITSRNKSFVIGVPFKDHFTDKQNIIQLERENNVVDILDVTNSNLTFTSVGTEETIDIDSVITEEFGNFKVSYSDSDSTGTATVVFTGVNVTNGVEFTATSNNFTDGNSYLIENDDLSNITFTYVSHYGKLDETLIEITSTNDEVVLFNEVTSHTYSDDTKEGVITANIWAMGSGTAYIDIYALHEGYNGKEIKLNYSSNLIVVRPEAQAGETVEKFTKITSASELTTGDYLIVCESKEVAFNGSLATLDAVNNYVNVTPTDGKIDATTDLKASVFTINVNGNSATIKSASGNYIGRTANSNGLNQTTTATTYTNSISFDNGNATIKASGGTVLKFNGASNQMRFRYYTSGQTAICLYKLTTVTLEAVDNYTGVINFINNYMQPSISHTDSGSGECVNWYAGENGAKAAFEALTTAEKNVLVTEYNEMFLRLQAWAIANGETIEYDPSAETYVIKNTNNSLMTINNSFDSTLLILFACISFVSVTAIVIVRKRKEH